jgi:ATP-dependent Clp protease ATP-binding subunit ClpC
MYERFTDRARKVIQLANQEAQRYNHEYIAPEHILLGLVKEGNGVGCLAIKNLDGDLRQLRLETEKMLQSGPDMITMGKLPMTPRAKKVIEISLELRRKFAHDHVGTEHLLLALLRVEESIAFDVFQKIGILFDSAEKTVLTILASTPESEEHPLSKRIAYQKHVKRKKERHRKLRSRRAEKRAKKKHAPKAPSAYERYTDRARKVLQLANQEAQRFNHEYIGTEHILLGLVKEGTGVASNVLKNLDVDLRKVPAGS